VEGRFARGEIRCALIDEGEKRIKSYAGDQFPLLSPITLSVNLGMIRSFADRETEKIWSGIRSRKLPPDMQDKVLIKLRMLNQARLLDDLRVPPRNRLEALKGDRKGQHSIRINDQWRICFRWTEGGPCDVKIIGYH
jgi:proteic killer suppression protein